MEKIIKFLGGGFEGVVLLTENDNEEKHITKFFRKELTEEQVQIIKLLNSFDLSFIFKLNIVNLNTIEYTYSKLYNIEPTIDNFIKILCMIEELYLSTRLAYFDLDIVRNNFMQDSENNIYCIDYINAFEKSDENELVYKLNLLNACLYIIDRNKSLNQRWINMCRHRKIIIPFVFIKTLLSMKFKGLNIAIIFKSLDEFFPILILFMKNFKYVK